MAEEKKMSYEEAMGHWQYMLLIEDWKRLTRVIASIAALLEVAIDKIKLRRKADGLSGLPQGLSYTTNRSMLEDILAGNKDSIGDITKTYKSLIGGETDFGQYCLAAMRKENMRLESEIVGLKAHIEALEKELGKEIENGDD